MSAANVAGAYVIVRDVFRLPHWWQQIEALDYKVPAELQLQLMDELMRLGRRATRWFLRSRRDDLDAARDVGHFAPRVAELAGRLDELLEGPAREQWLARYQSFVEAGAPEELARVVAGTSHLYTLLPIIEAADVTGQPAADVATAYFAVGGALELSRYLQQLTSLPVENNWQALAREAFRDDWTGSSAPSPWPCCRWPRGPRTSRNAWPTGSTSTGRWCSAGWPCRPSCARPAASTTPCTPWPVAS